ncbi:restriction endonuclease [Priestia aryabhattai]|uniref:5-methylcytosine restriction system specificity protein McrC n=1 Tax=Priestia aryabhattai TaxID=412384 RepID=UPI001C8D6692|nr:restriction endonuclease [Priestia aryabhattai]MBX9971141.1 restriction endonuclease [Priestia aryabhattai]
MKSVIPIQNIYYMLCYCSGILPEKQEVEVTGIGKTGLLDLFAEIFAKRLNSFVKRSFYKEYIPYEESTPTVKGKILFKESVAQVTLLKASLVCSRDEFSANIIHNQILKSTMHLLISHTTLRRPIKEHIKSLYRYFHEIDLVKIDNTSFDQLKLHRNNHHYRSILEICRIIHNYTLIDEESGTLSFIDFDREEKMEEVFESFIRNFYRVEQKEYQVYQETIHWEIGQIFNGDRLLIPKMQTDVCLVNKRKKIIIDAKYYQQVFEKNYRGENKINSANLFQLYSYLSNADKRTVMEGILLYPQTNQEVNMAFEMKGYKIKVLTINLNQHWSKIRKQLLDIL